MEKLIISMAMFNSHGASSGAEGAERFAATEELLAQGIA